MKRLDSLAALLDRLGDLGVTLPIAEHVDPAGPLAQPLTIHDRAAGALVAPNRFAVLPMEGWDGTEDGQPTDLVRRRWSNFGSSGCGLVWGEATAVRADGRANPRQLLASDATIDGLAELRSLLAPGQVAGLQLTHSGRWSRPAGSPEPRTAYRHPLLDERVGASAASVLSDDELDDLVGAYVDAAVVASDAGFDFVDVKHCHGYLLHELLSARDRPGRFGGDLAGRTHFLSEVVAGIRSRSPKLGVAVRLSTFDLVPYRAGTEGVGEPEGGTPYPFAFGGDGTGLGIDLSETDVFLDRLEELGIGLVSTTAGSPYYNPHVQRPAWFPPSDGYQPPEDPLMSVARQVAVTADLAARHPGIALIGSGYTYLQQWLPHVGQAVIAGGGAAMIGLGRMVLSYPHLAADVLAGLPLEGPRLCRTISDCTTAPRNGLISGCYPLDPFYKARPERAVLAQIKRSAAPRSRPQPGV